MTIERNAIIVHGKPHKRRYEQNPAYDPSQANWLPWVGDRLREDGHTVAIPSFAEPTNPNYNAWKDQFETHAVDEHTTLIGHSYGAAFLLHWLCERGDLTVGKVALVAPWLYDPDRRYPDAGLDFSISVNVARQALNGMVVLYSSGDDEKARKSTDIIRAALPDVRYRDLPNHGHFMIGNAMHGPEFPELLEEIR